MLSVRIQRKRFSISDKFVLTKVCLKEGTKIELQRDISQIGLQIVYCRLLAGFFQVVDR